MPTKKFDNKEKFGNITEDLLDDWEKNMVKKLFKEVDKDKNGMTKQELSTLLKRLANDDAIIGKVPNLNEA
jgi:hypothetical protein